MTIRMLIADDEPSARAKLRRLIRAEADLELVAECADGREAASAIAAHAPDAVLLDIQMPELDGIEAIAALPADRRPIVVFVTAFDTHAVRAFEAHASDYLLKPFGASRFQVMLDRVRELHELRKRPGPGAAAAGDRYLERVEVRSVGRMEYVEIGGVEWIEAEGNYVRLHGPDGRPLLRESLSGLLRRLDPARFARIHRSAAVNLACVRDVKPRSSGDSVVTLRSGARLRLSRSFRAQFLRRLRANAGPTG